jgi:Zn-dependent protease
LIASAALFLILVAQSLLGVYENRLQGAWGWALPNFVPTLALMISVFAADALKGYDETETLKVRRPFFRLSLGLSVFYLIVLLGTILAQPFVLTFRTGNRLAPIEILELSNLWLGPLQGLVVAALGVLFFLKENGVAPQKNAGNVPTSPNPASTPQLGAGDQNSV